jgi:hypothetical protein
MTTIAHDPKAELCTASREIDHLITSEIDGRDIIVRFHIIAPTTAALWGCLMMVMIPSPERLWLRTVDFSVGCSWGRILRRDVGRGIRFGPFIAHGGGRGTLLRIPLLLSILTGFAAWNLLVGIIRIGRTINRRMKREHSSRIRLYRCGHQKLWK